MAVETPERFGRSMMFDGSSPDDETEGGRVSDEPRDATDTGAPAGEPDRIDRPGSSVPAASDSSHVPSAPWERPRRWNPEALDATRVDDLLAKLGSGDDAPSGRRRRRQADSPAGTGLSASELIAALSADDGGAAAIDPTNHSSDHHVDAGVDDHSGDYYGVDHPSVGEHTADDHGIDDPDAPTSRTPDPTAAAHPAPLPPVAIPPASSTPAPAEAQATAVLSGSVPVSPWAAGPSSEDATPLPPRIGPDDKAPIRDLGDEPRTDYIPKMTGGVADRAEAESILASLRQQSRPASAASEAVYGGGSTPPPPPPVGGNGGRGPSDPPPRRRKGLLLAGRGIAAAVAVITLLGMGVEWKIKDRADSSLADHAITGALNAADPNISSARTVPLVVTNSKGVKTTEAAPPKASYAPENILLLGSDTRAGSNGNAGNEGPGTAGTANSDTLMVAHISGDRSHVTVLSIPRDTLVPAPKCKIWNSTSGVLSDQYEPINAGEVYHINSAYSVGGPTCTVTAVQSLTHLGITRVISIDFSGFQAMVDALHGVDVNVCRPIVDSVLGTVIPTAGEQTIGGVQALNLVRARHVVGDNLSDLARIRRQQVVLSAILRQVTQAGTLLNPKKLDNFLQAFAKNTSTQNVKVDDLVTLAGSLGSLDPAHVTFYTLPTVPSTVVDGALDVDQTKAPAIFDDLINDLPLPGELSTPATPKAGATPTPIPAPAAPSLKLTVAPAAVNLEIHNLTGQANVATAAQQKLNAIGFKVSDGQLFKPESGAQTGSTVLYSAPNRDAALTVAAAVPDSTLVVTAGLGTTVRLDLGSSFAGKIVPVKIGDTAPASLSTVSTGPAVTGTSGATASTALSSVNAGAGTCA
jgi:LCP family protein required for cell wall assembly